MATFPSGTCTARSTWKIVGGFWTPVIRPPATATFEANCTAPLHFVENGTPFLVKPPDFGKNPEFLAVRAANPGINTPDGLTHAQKAALDNRFPGAAQDVTGLTSGAAPEFTLPMVPIGTGPIDITLPPTNQ